MPPAKDRNVPKTPGLTFDDWNEISRRIESMIAQAGLSFVQGKVIKNDLKKKLVWIKELGDTPIPLVAYDYIVKIYINGEVQERPCEIVVPEVGQTVLVALHLGSRRLPKCLGRIHSTGYL